MIHNAQTDVNVKNISVTEIMNICMCTDTFILFLYQALPLTASLLCQVLCLPEQQHIWFNVTDMK